MSNVPAYPKNPLLNEETTEAQTRVEAPSSEAPLAAVPPLLSPESEVPESLWQTPLSELIEHAPIATVIAAGCAGILAGLSMRWLIAR